MPGSSSDGGGGTKRVAVVGAGASGLTAIKCCRDAGLEVTCFELTDDIGGLWRYSAQVVGKERASVMKSTVINTSKEMMSYSDFPMPRHFPVFTHNTLVLEYFRLFADAFRLRDHIRLGTRVLSVRRNGDYDETGRWLVRTRKEQGGEETEEVFDGVLLATGHHATPHEPDLAGLADFQGSVKHTHDYKDFAGYEDKNVLIIGVGNSGVDVAVELSNVSKQVYLSTRRGTWVLNRLVEKGLPIDMMFNTRPMTWAMDKLPTLTSKFATFRLNNRFDHDTYGLRPDHGPFAGHLTVNDYLPNKIASGTVKIMPDIRKFTKNSVVFVDGTEKEIDSVILATGYVFGFPYLEEGVVPVKNNEVNLYKFVFPPDLKHKTIGVLGCIQPVGAVMPISEIQARWFCQVLRGHVKLPDSSQMQEDVKRTREAMAKAFYSSQRHTIQVTYVSYCDEIAEMIGCKPDLVGALTTDPLLGLKLIFGPVTPYQYRLKGPNAWPGARQAVMTAWQRTTDGLRPDHLRDKPAKSLGFLDTKLIVAAVLFVFLVYLLFF